MRKSAESRSLPLSLHPKALFDAPYERHDLDTAQYTPITAPWSTGPTGIGAVVLQSGAARFRAECPAEGILRLRWNPAGEVAESVTEKLGLIQLPEASTGGRVEIAGSTASLQAGTLRGSMETATGGWVVDRGGDPLLSPVEDMPRFSPRAPTFGAGHRFLTMFHRQGQERFFGLGGRIACPDRTGTSADMYAMKVGLYSGDYGGFPIPLVLSTRGYAVFLNNPWPHVYFDLAKTDPDRWWMHAAGGDLDLFIIDGAELADIARRFTSLVGRIPVPKRWWLGFWVSALAFSSAKEVESVARRLREEQYPADAVVLDGPWRGGPDFLKLYMSDGQYPTNDLNWHPDFGDGPAMVSKLGEMGFRTVLHQNSRSWLPETADRAVSAGLLRREGQETVVRFTYPKAETFYAEATAPRHGEGIGTWWLDHGDRVDGEIRPGVPSRNLFGSLWARATQQGMRRDGLGEQLCLIRGAGIGSQPAALPWPGDTRYGLDFFLEDLWFCMNAGLCGFPITSADLGGFRPVEIGEPGHNQPYDLENLARRLCQGIVLIPSPRMHQCDSHPPKLPWNCPAEVQNLYRHMLELRYSLTPYLYALAVHASRTGEPVLRPMVYHYREDQRAVACHDQCMLGEWILAAPVHEYGARERTVYLPEGLWQGWWDGARYEGPTEVTVDAPLLEPCGLPLFVKAGAVIPTQPVTPNLDDRVPEQLTLEIFAGSDGRFDCPEGQTAESWFIIETVDSETRVTVHNGADISRTFHLRMHGLSRVSGVTVEGRQQDFLWERRPVGMLCCCSVEVSARHAVNVALSPHRSP